MFLRLEPRALLLGAVAAVSTRRTDGHARSVPGRSSGEDVQEGWPACWVGRSVYRPAFLSATVLDRVPAVLDRVPAVLDRVLSMLDRVLSMLDRVLNVLDRVLDVLDRVP